MPFLFLSQSPFFVPDHINCRPIHHEHHRPTIHGKVCAIERGFRSRLTPYRRWSPTSHQQVYVIIISFHCLRRSFRWNTRLTWGRCIGIRGILGNLSPPRPPQKPTLQSQYFPLMDGAWVLPLLRRRCSFLWNFAMPFRQDDTWPTQLGPFSSQLNRVSDESSELVVRNYSTLCCLISTITGWLSIKLNWIAANLAALHVDSTYSHDSRHGMTYSLDGNWLLRITLINYVMTSCIQNDLTIVIDCGHFLSNQWWVMTLSTYELSWRHSHSQTYASNIRVLLSEKE